MMVAFDIDHTITAVPALFAVLSRAVRAAGGKVYIVTSRSDTPEVRDSTRRELDSYGVEFDEIVIIPEGRNRIPCPHADLDWFHQYLWQKVAACLDRGVDVVFEDDSKVVALFKAYAPDITAFHVGGKAPGASLRRREIAAFVSEKRWARENPDPAGHRRRRHACADG